MVEQRLGRHQHARRAIAALRGEIVHEGLSAADAAPAPVLQPVGGLDRAALDAFRPASGRRDAPRRRSARCRRRSRPGRSRISASGRRRPSRSASSRLAPPSTKTATSRPLCRNCRAVLAMGSLQASWPSNSRRRCTPTTSRRYQVAGDRVGRRARSPRPRPRPRRRCRLRRGPAFQRAFGGLGADRGRRHRAIGDARAGDPAADIGDMNGERDHRGALRLDARDLAVAERLGAGRPRQETLVTSEPARGRVAARNSSIAISRLP